MADLTIWKAAIVPHLGSGGLVTLHVPMHSVPLSVALQKGVPTLWFRCNPERELQRRSVWLRPTGEKAPVDGQFLGTLLLHDGDLVLHAFAVGW